MYKAVQAPSIIPLAQLPRRRSCGTMSYKYLAAYKSLGMRERRCTRRRGKRSCATIANEETRMCVRKKNNLWKMITSGGAGMDNAICTMSASAIVRPDHRGHSMFQVQHQLQHRSLRTLSSQTSSSSFFVFSFLEFSIRLHNKVH